MGRILFIPRTKYKPHYGLIYNYYAANHADKITSSNNWIIPSYSNIHTLSIYLSGDTVSGGKMKEMGTTYWDSPNMGATNESLFNGRGSGTRDGTNGTFASKLRSANFWTTTINYTYYPDVFTLVYNYDDLYFQSAVRIFKDGLSIRLVKISTILSNGQEGTYIGNDGKTYRTICIGTQEWLDDNLCETKYRNGNVIPEVTNNSAWAALTTGALCVYDNDWNNA